MVVELEHGTVGSLILSHTPSVRKGLTPELELHGTEASLSADRITGRITLARPDRDAELFETVESSGIGNRFVPHVFPARREPTVHPTMEDGWRASCLPTPPPCPRSAVRGFPAGSDDAGSVGRHLRGGETVVKVFENRMDEPALKARAFRSRVL